MERDETESERVLSDYLETCAQLLPAEIPRRRCPNCDRSTVLYCSSCPQIVVDTNGWPEQVRRKPVRLPFQVDVLLDDRHGSSTGIQAVAILQAEDPDSARILEVEDKPENIPDYGSDDGTFLLFPGPDSVSLSEIPPNSIRILVVLDCKWTRSRLRFHSKLSHIQKVHLDDPPSQSFFWRWHRAGPGMLSTIEALYCAARQITDDDDDNVVGLLWLFAMQREIIRRAHEKGNGSREHLPYSQSGKDVNRAFRERTTDGKEAAAK